MFDLFLPPWSCSYPRGHVLIDFTDSYFRNSEKKLTTWAHNGAFSFRDIYILHYFDSFVNIIANLLLYIIYSFYMIYVTKKYMGSRYIFTTIFLLSCCSFNNYTL